ncbi:MAG: Hsp20/alpha crystallin family protein [Gammaproteobacteria bacterium]|nr:Hsp20/alpha crystallin family protein [Gammaproteobacteria bacterium]
MSNLIRERTFGPWAMHRELLNEFNRYIQADSAATHDGSSGATADWVPAVDIAEYADRFVLHADVPGIDPASIEVTLEKGVLSLSGSREKDAEAGSVERRRIERAHGRFFRRFSLPDTVDSEAVSARGANGVLEVVIPKRPTAQPRRISVAH